MATISITYTSTKHGIVNFTYALDETGMDRVVEAFKQDFKSKNFQRFSPDPNTGNIPSDPSLEEVLDDLSYKLINYVVATTHEMEINNKVQQFRVEVPHITIR